MLLFSHRAGFSFILLLFVSACATGGGGDNGGAGNPSPNPPPPPPAPLTNSTLDALQADETFNSRAATLEGTASSGGRNARIGSARIPISSGVRSVIYNASEDSYTIDYRIGSANRLYEQTFRPEDIDSTASTSGETLYRRDGDTLRLSNAGSPEFPVRYVASAIWATESATNQTGFTTFLDFEGVSVFGIETAPTDMPNSGRASYPLIAQGLATGDQGDFDLSGDGVLSYDFVTGLGELDLSLFGTNSAGVTSFWDDLSGVAELIGGPVIGASNYFYGNLSSSAATRQTTNNQFNGAFFGPNAQEVGGLFIVGDSTTPLGRDAIGTFVGAADASPSPPTGFNETLTSLQHSQIFNAWFAEIELESVSSGSRRKAITDRRVIAYDVATDSFTVSLRGSQANTFGTDQIDMAESDPAVTRYTNNGDEFALARPGASDLGLTYVAMGAWETDPFFPSTGSPTDGIAQRYFVYGIRTPSADIPRSGTAVYELAARGALVPYGTDVLRTLVGEGELNVDFGARSYGVNMQLFLSGPDFSSQIPGLPGLPLWSLTGSRNNGFASSVPGVADMSVFLSFANDPELVGELRANFFGPNLEEVGGAFWVNTDNEAASGVFLGARTP